MSFHRPVHLSKFTVDGLKVFSGDDDSCVRCFDISSGDKVNIFEEHKDYIRCGDANKASRDIILTGTMSSLFYKRKYYLQILLIWTQLNTSLVWIISTPAGLILPETTRICALLDSAGFQSNLHTGLILPWLLCCIYVNGRIGILYRSPSFCLLSTVCIYSSYFRVIWPHGQTVWSSNQYQHHERKSWQTSGKRPLYAIRKYIPHCRYDNAKELLIST